MKPHIIILSFLILFASCNKQKSHYEKDIVGAWQFEKYEFLQNSDSLNMTPPPLPHYYEKHGFIFNSSGYYESKPGIWGYDKKTYRYKLYDKPSDYSIVGDSLKLYNSYKNKWSGYKIKSITNDTLILLNDNYLVEKYSKINCTINPNEHYDAIILSTSGCYGSCPVTDISIEKSGKVIFSGQDYVTDLGLYTSKISSKKWDDIENEFKKADIDDLNDVYSANHTDDETITVTFIKNRKIFKSVTDYGHMSPMMFQAAYTSMRYIHQDLKLKPMKILFNSDLVWYAIFESADKSYSLTKSESFYLVTELLNAKQSAKVFKTKYKIEYGSYTDKKIIDTDGRYFKFREKDEVTLDLGYNFLDKNKITF